MPIRAQMADGAVLEFPDGTPDSVVDRAAQEYAAGGAPAPAEPPRMNIKQFGSQVLERVRAGESPESIRQWASTVRNPEDPTGLVRYTIGPELEKTAEIVSHQPGVPVGFSDTTKGDPLGAAVRAAADAATFNSADEIQAGLTALFSDRSYQSIVDDLRAQRAIDAQTNQAERGVGMALGTIASAPLVPARLFQGANLLGSVGRASGIGAGMSALSEAGAAQTVDEAVENMPRALAEGAAISAAIPIAGAGVRGLVNQFGTVVDPNFAARRAIQSAGLDAGELERRAAEFTRIQNREPALGEILSELEGQRFTAALAPSETVRARVVNAANEAKRNLGPGLERRIREAPAETATASAPFTMARAQDAIEGGATPMLGAEARDLAARPAARSEVAPQGRELGEPRRVIDGGDLFGEGVSQGATGRPFERVMIDLPNVEIPRVATPGKLEEMAGKFADNAWSKFRDIPFRFTPEDATYFEEFVLPNLSLPKLTRERILRNYASDNMTVGDMDIVRRSLGSQAQRGGAAKVGNTDYRDLKEDVMAMMADVVPATRDAVKKYASLMQAAEGARIGKIAAKPETDLIDFVDSLAKLKTPAKQGVAPGARASVIAQGLGNPAEAYKFATEIESNTGFGRRFAAAVGPKEAADLAEYAMSAKRGIDSLFSMARIAPDKIPSALRTVDDLINTAAVGTLGAGGAFKANVVSTMLARAKIGERQAERLADMLLDPKRRKDAIKAIGNLPRTDLRAKVSRGASDIIRYAFVKTASDIGKDNARMPENRISVGMEER
jgi:hypothetical protein